MPGFTNNLSAIKEKVRKLTRSPSDSQLTDDQLLSYIDTFILYNFPSSIRLFSLRQVFTFYTQPNVDTYQTNNIPNDPFNNFQNIYLSVHEPVFLAGIQGFFTQWRDVFYGYYPQTNTIADTLLRGNTSVGPFTGVVTAAPMLQNNVNFNCLDMNGTSMVVVDYPTSNLIGALGLYGQSAATATLGFIDYVTGQFSVSFPNPTQDMAIIYVENIAYQPGKPLALLYYNNQFTVRPVPDKTYSISVEADVRPTQLLNNGDIPQLEQWWQWIAYGAAKLIFEDRMDLESVQLIMPEYNKQERMVLRTSIMQKANERTVTIYTQGKNFGFGWFGPGGWPY